MRFVVFIYQGAVTGSQGYKSLSSSATVMKRHGAYHKAHDCFVNVVVVALISIKKYLLTSPSDPKWILASDIIERHFSRLVPILTIRAHSASSDL